MPKPASDLDRLTLQVDRLALQIEKLTTQIGALVGIYDNVLAKIEQLKTAVTDELQQIRDAIAEARSSGDPAGLAEVETRLDEVITSVSNLAEEATAEVPADTGEEPV